jgi:acetylornithine deacetylase/succinyl-diaminopimelate desuccinylase-like protein
MTSDMTISSRLNAARDDDQALDLLREAVRTPSVTGDELRYARVAAAQLNDVVDMVEVQDFAPGRANTWSRTGSGDRPGILFVGHLDTVSVRGWEKHWADTERQDPYGAVIHDGAVWGRGVADCKSGISGVTAAMHLLRRAGYRPGAPVTTFYVADEESGEPGSGTSAGIRHVIEIAQRGEIGLNADLAVYVEPSNLNVWTAHLGFFVVEVDIQGKTAYWGTPEHGIDALRAAGDILQAIWRYDDKLRAQPPAPLIGSPFILATGATAGEGLIAVPGDAHISLIRKLVPGEDLDAARAELESVIQAAAGGINVRTAYPARRDHPIGGTPYVVDPELEPVLALRRIIQASAPGRGGIEAAPGWSEGPFLQRDIGVPTVYFAAGDLQYCHTFNEHVDVDDYLTSVLVYAQFIADRCGLVEI